MHIYTYHFRLPFYGRSLREEEENALRAGLRSAKSRTYVRCGARKFKERVTSNTDA